MCCSFNRIAYCECFNYNIRLFLSFVEWIIKTEKNRNYVHLSQATLLVVLFQGSDLMLFAEAEVIPRDGLDFRDCFCLFSKSERHLGVKVCACGLMAAELFRFLRGRRITFGFFVEWHQRNLKFGFFFVKNRVYEYVVSGRECTQIGRGSQTTYFNAHSGST